MYLYFFFSHTNLWGRILEKQIRFIGTEYKKNIIRNVHSENRNNIHVYRDVLTVVITIESPKNYYCLLY